MPIPTPEPPVKIREIAGRLIDEIPGYLGMTPDPWPADAEEAATEQGRRRGWDTCREEIIGRVAEFLTPELEALLLQRAQEIAELQKQLLWRDGDADAFAEHLRQFLTWMECDLGQNGDGPSGGYVSRRDKAAWALECGLALLALLTARAQEIEQVQAEARAQVVAEVRAIVQRDLSDPDCVTALEDWCDAELSAALVSRAPQQEQK